MFPLNPPWNASNERVVTEEDVLPIDLTLQRKAHPSSLQTPASDSIYICPICGEEQLTLDRFVDHMTTHRWKKLPVAPHERSWLLLAKSSLLKSSRRLRLLRRSRKRHREPKHVSSTRSSDIKREGQISFHCPACPTFQRIIGIQAAVNHFENSHMQIIVVCNICGMWFSSQTMFASHVAVVHLRTCSENLDDHSSSQTLQSSSSPPPAAATSITAAGDLKDSQQVIDPVVASILFSGLLLSTQSTLFPGATSQNWKDSESKITVANGIDEKSSQVTNFGQIYTLEANFFQEFADEMAVLKHQVLVHRLEETTTENSA
ncbi:unnamed protein product [Hydatigera taeniaeformis]|uniref:C2H2-type domain-containing protein n=1 Tax=Hydatigena taeniaeformis TaxID=6205 RepID=A0A158REU3_HYDTA|nr:unnamed protein product [Hydatigera taeniaeformis]